MFELDVMLRIKAMELLSKILELVTLEAEYGSIDSLDNILKGTEEIYQYLKEGKTNVGT
jgi:bacterioferritin (cytochrome b1)